VVSLNLLPLPSPLDSLGAPVTPSTTFYSFIMFKNYRTCFYSDPWHPVLTLFPWVRYLNHFICLVLMGMFLNRFPFLIFPPFSTSQSVWTHSLKPASQLNPQDHRCFRWRLERNFWISVLAFTVWLVLGRFRSALKESEKYRCALKEAESKTN
jgi:hypothetical protein